MGKNKSVGVHETAQAYNKVSEAYERGRPEYTLDSVKALVDRLRIKKNSRVLDLGAGTGKFTKFLVQYCSNVTAVEPIPAMREILTDNLQELEVLDGSAESIPAKDDSFDAVIVANAFHWFDAPKALDEVSRVLKPHGGLGLIWLNDGVFSSAWGKVIDQMLVQHETLAPQHKSGIWQKAFEETTSFSQLQELKMPHFREVTSDIPCFQSNT